MSSGDSPISVRGRSNARNRLDRVPFDCCCYCCFCDHCPGHPSRHHTIDSGSSHNCCRCYFDYSNFDIHSGRAKIVVVARMNCPDFPLDNSHSARCNYCCCNNGYSHSVDCCCRCSTFHSYLRRYLRYSRDYRRLNRFRQLSSCKCERFSSIHLHSDHPPFDSEEPIWKWDRFEIEFNSSEKTRFTTHLARPAEQNNHDSDRNPIHFSIVRVLN